jgi:adenylate cyclase
VIPRLYARQPRSARGRNGRRLRAVSDDRDSSGQLPGGPRKPGNLRERARRTDSKPQLVATAKFIRQLLPGDDRHSDPLSTVGTQVPQRIGRLVSEVEPQRPSAVRELGLGALQAWQALSEAQGRGRGRVDVAILFTDIVGFSSWALDAGDEAALELLSQVAAAEDTAISVHGGSLVKRLGDGAMAVFRAAQEAVQAALQAQRDLGQIEVNGHTPELRAGVHLGRPRRVGGDYLGIDVNIAARVGEAAKGGQLLISESAREALDPQAFKFGRNRRLSATGAPRDLSVCSVSVR